MKILLTATVQSHICQFHKPLVQMLHAHGCEVHVAARDNLAEKNGLKLDFVEKVYDLPFSRSPKSKDNIAAYKQLKAILEQEHYDIVHCNTPMGGIVTRLAAKKARKQGTKVFYAAHGFHFYKGASKKNWAVYYPIEKRFAKLSDKLITINREDYALAKEKMDTEVHYIHGVGVDEQRYTPATAEEKAAIRKELGYGEDQKMILCIGELLPNKNQTMAIRMMAEVVKTYPDAQLLLAGNGPEKENLEQAIADNGMENNVRMLGYCTCLEKYQKAVDLLVACSKREGLGLNIVEAMLSANPIVATKNRGHRDLVEDGVTGYLVDLGDVPAMANRVLSLLNDVPFCEKMGSCGRAYAEYFSFSAVKKELEKIYFG